MDSEASGSVWNADCEQSRVEVIKEDVSLLLKRQDVTVSRLARIFKIVPSTIYLEEDMTTNVEFPNADGKFQLPTRRFGVRYKVCGDQERDADLTSGPGSANPSDGKGGWCTLRPWMQRGRPLPLASSSFPPSSSSKKNVLQTYESYYRRCIPLVSLAFDSKKNLSVDTIHENVYVKIPESSISVPAVLSAIGGKVSIAAEDLILLDSKFCPVTDNKELDFWKCPSRRLFVTRNEEFEQLLAEQRERKLLNLSLTRKRKASRAGMADDDGEAINRIETTVETMNNTVLTLSKKLAKLREPFTAVQHSVLQQFECKICNSMPDFPVLTTCCSQVLGCRECYDRAIEGDVVCPLCRSGNMTVVPIKGMEEIYGSLKKFASVADTD